MRSAVGSRAVSPRCEPTRFSPTTDQLADLVERLLRHGVACARTDDRRIMGWITPRRTRWVPSVSPYLRRLSGRMRTYRGAASAVRAPGDGHLARAPGAQIVHG